MTQQTTWHPLNERLLGALEATEGGVMLRKELGKQWIQLARRLPPQDRMVVSAELLAAVKRLYSSGMRVGLLALIKLVGELQGSRLGAMLQDADLPPNIREELMSMPSKTVELSKPTHFGVGLRRAAPLPVGTKKL